ncbi:glutamate racemase [Salinicola corii]|uniref:Glutamate racemase n=1 Tax=Salinicola corii TaxID=2606937 RepID=A0A640W915_9GAMM|nr:glutamate racemase [Salinicola corii]KAA0016261.1 glutamate racemase [Salinicola corii]
MIDALIFDSGVGGLSVSEEIRRRMPDCSLGYLCDNAALPYGTKRDDWLIARIVAVCVNACELARPRVLVIACNTASTLALEALRANLSIPVIGTVPAIKPAAEASRSRTIGLLATGATVHRPYLNRLITDHAPDCRVVRVAADALVTQAESHLAGKSVDVRALQLAVAPLKAAADLDVVVLGCTHFPLLRGLLEPLMPDVRWIDSGVAIARRLNQVLTDAQSVFAPQGEASGAPSWATAPWVESLAPILRRFGYSPPLSLEIASPAVASHVS